MHNSFYTIPCVPGQSVSPGHVRDYVPVGLATTDMATRILPIIVACYITIVTSTARTAPRIAYLNTAAQNNWNNNETYSAYGDVLDMLRVMVQENRIVNPVDGIQGAVEAVIIYRISILCANDPNIMHYIDQGMVQEMQQKAMEYSNFRQGVEHYRRLTEQSRYAESFQKINLSAAFQGGTAGTGMFAAGGPQAEGGLGHYEVNEENMSHYERRAAEARRRSQEEQAAAAINFGLPGSGYGAIPMADLEPVKVITPVKWVPSNEQHYVDLYRPRTQEYEVKVVQLPESTISVNGKETKEYTRFIIQDKEKPVDRALHITSNTALINQALMAEVPAHYASRGEAVTETMKAIAVNLTTKPENRDGDIIQFLKDNLKKSNYSCPSVFSVREAIAQTWLYHKAEAGEDFTATAFMQEFSLITNFVTVGKYVDEVKRIMTMATPLLVADEILKVSGAKDTPRELRAILSRIDRLITAAVNDLLLNKLSLDVSIESFTADFDDLVPFMSKTYAEIYYESFSAGMIKILRGSMKVVENHDVVTISVTSDDSEEEGVPSRICTNAFGFKNSLTVTTLDVLAAELEFGFYRQDNFDMPARIMESNHAVIFWYVKSLFDTDHPYISKGGRHLLVTADDQVFEVHRGLIGQDNYLISKATFN